jgi:S1-C subfamily serine protease
MAQYPYEPPRYEPAPYEPAPYEPTYSEAAGLESLDAKWDPQREPKQRPAPRTTLNPYRLQPARPLSTKPATVRPARRQAHNLFSGKFLSSLLLFFALGVSAVAGGVVGALAVLELRLPGMLAQQLPHTVARQLPEVVSQQLPEVASQLPPVQAVAALPPTPLPTPTQDPALLLLPTPTPEPPPAAGALPSVPAMAEESLTSTLAGGAATVAGAVYRQASAAVVQITTQSPPSARRTSGHGVGSGFVVDMQGLIVTNNHVIKEATSIRVSFMDGTVRPATVLLVDETHDLALLQVELPAGVPMVRLGDSDAVAVGDLAIAIGSPFGLEQSVTQGIISAVHRNWPPRSSNSTRTLLQTDAPINPGNSGGPLFNATGEVIGINTLIQSPVSGSVGIGFAVPINRAKELLQ